jgi:ubiquinone/menaquinone biosynthesis C-methylase UbiE
MSFYSKLFLPKILDASMRRKEIDSLRPKTVGKATGVVLEIGFGSGLNLSHYKKIEALYALDPSGELFDLARERVGIVSFPVTFIQAGAEKIPLDDHSVDTVVSTWSLCSIPHPEQALAEVARVLRPGGRFLFVEHGKSPASFWLTVQKIGTPFTKIFAGGCHLDRDILRIITQNGFMVEKVDTFPLKGKPLAYMYQGIAVKSSLVS